MRKRDKQPPKTKKYFRSTKSGAGMTKAGVARYRRSEILFSFRWLSISFSHYAVFFFFANVATKKKTA